MRTPLIRLFLIALVFLAAGCGDDKENTSETATTGEFTLLADETLRPAIDSLLIGFSKENPHSKVTVKYVSAGEAMQSLLNKDARAVIIGRSLTETERGLLSQYKLQLPEFDMAVDGIGCIVSSKSPLQAIALSDLKALYASKSASWSDSRHSIPGTLPTASVIKVLPRYPSSTEYVLDSLFLAKNAVVQGKVERYATTDSIIARVKDDPHAIGFIGSSWKHWLESKGDSSVRLIPIIPADSSSAGVTKPIILHLAYVYQGLYPLTTKVQGYSFENANTLPRGFFAYATTAHGQTVFKNFEILPKTQIIKIVPSR